MTPTQEWVRNYLERQYYAMLSINSAVLEDAIDLLRVARRDGKRIFVIGNGGSACNASHFAQDLGKGSSDAVRNRDECANRFKARSLCDNISYLTAISNDYTYNDIFWRQLENEVEEGDLLIAISVSGTSDNVRCTVQYAKSMGLNVISLIGNRDNGERQTIATDADVVLKIDDDHFGRVEDVQMMCLHVLSYYFIENDDF